MSDTILNHTCSLQLSLNTKKITLVYSLNSTEIIVQIAPLYRDIFELEATLCTPTEHKKGQTNGEDN